VLDLVYLGRQREKLTQSLLLVAAVRDTAGKGVKDAIENYAREVYPGLDLRSEEKKRHEALAEEMGQMAQKVLVFSIPAQASGAPLRGFGSHIGDALAENRKVRRRDAALTAPDPSRPAPTAGPAVPPGRPRRG
jgi:hypothetical protein